MEAKTKRNSSIELVKIIAMIIIVLSHSMPDGDSTMPASHIDIDYATTNIQIIIAQIFKAFGHTGNILFLLASCWFMIGSKKTNVKKIADIVGDSFVVSVTWMIVFLALGYDLGIKEIFKQFFPVTFNHCWFVTCFLIFYAVHPLLSYAIENMSKKKLMTFNIIYFVMYNCIGFLMHNTYFYYSDLIGFFGLYFLVAYIKQYMQDVIKNTRLNVLLVFGGIVFELLLLLATAIGGTKVSFLDGQMMRWDTFMNPCLLMLGIGLFDIAINMQFYNKVINYISSLSLLIYMIHANFLVRQYGRFDLFAWIKQNFGYERLVIWMLLFALINFVGAMIIATLYDKTFRKLVHTFFEKILEICSRFYT